MIDVYYAPTPNGWKITALLEQLKDAGCGLDYKVVPVNLAKGDQQKPEFLAISPNGRMPAIVDHEVIDPATNKPFSCFESAAIMIYLNDKANGPFLSTETLARNKQIQWLFWVQGGLGPMAGQVSHFVNYAPHIDPKADHSYSLTRYSNEYKRLLSVMDNELAKTNFLGSSVVSIADFAAYPWVIPYKRFGVDLSAYPNVRKWFDRLKSMDGVQRGVNVLKANIRVGGANMSSEAKKLLFTQKETKAKL